MHIERVKRIVIWGLVLLICLLIWPVCLVRKDAESMPNLEAAYGKSDVVDIAIPLTGHQVVRQSLPKLIRY